MKGANPWMIATIILLVLAIAGTNLIGEMTKPLREGQSLTPEKAISSFGDWAKQNMTLPIWLLLGLIIVILMLK